jgi:hypothetical protein
LPDLGQQLVDRDAVLTAVGVLELERSRPAVPREMDADRRRVGPKPRDQIIELAQLVDPHADVVVQRPRDRIALSLVVELAAFGRRDVDHQGHRRLWPVELRRALGRDRAGDIEMSVGDREAAVDSEQLPGQRQDQIVVALDHQKRRWRIAPRNNSEKLNFLRQQRLAERLAERVSSGIEGPTLLVLLQPLPAQLPEGIQRAREPGLAEPGHVRGALDRLGVRPPRCDPPVTTLVVSEGDRQGQRWQRNGFRHLAELHLPGADLPKERLRGFGEKQVEDVAVARCDDAARCIPPDLNAATVGHGPGPRLRRRFPPRPEACASSGRASRRPP